MLDGNCAFIEIDVLCLECQSFGDAATEMEEEKDEEFVSEIGGRLLQEF